jgi:hypothetical protein
MAVRRRRRVCLGDEELEREGEREREREREREIRSRL